MYLETMQQIFANTAKVMIDARSGSNLLYLPLDKLIAQTVAQDSARSAQPSIVPAPAPLPDVQQDMQRQRDARGRESREREAR